jgi:DNA-binding NarL/FixJ family response regulator
MLNPESVATAGNAGPQGLRAPQTARVIIAEDHPIMRDGLIDLLEHEPAVELVGCADSALEVENLIRVHEPDLLVLDLTLGADDGVLLAQRLLWNRPKLRIVVLSMHDEMVFADRLLAMGVRAYLTKDRTRTEFLLAVRCALEGRTYLTAEQLRRRDSRINATESMTPELILSARELAVLRLLATGMTSAAIATELNVAAKTVYSHRRNISLKLGIASGRDMLRYAVHWSRGAG